MVSIRDTLSIALESLKILKDLSNKCKHKESKTQNIEMSHFKLKVLNINGTLIIQQ